MKVKYGKYSFDPFDQEEFRRGQWDFGFGVRVYNDETGENFLVDIGDEYEEDPVAKLIKGEIDKLEKSSAAAKRLPKGWTDERLEKLEKKIDEEYAQAAKELSEKHKSMMKSYEAERAQRLKALDDTAEAKEVFDNWCKTEAGRIARVNEAASKYAEIATTANERAFYLAKQELPTIFAQKANFERFAIDRRLGTGTAFGLVDQYTVRNLLVNEPNLLPAPRLNAAKDLRWNTQKFASAITQGILQGESVPAIANRLEDVLGMDSRFSLNAARTAITGAENAGRLFGHEKAKEIGIGLKSEWLATLDNRTRHSHRALDGEKVEVGEKFSNGCRYPGDPEGRPEEVYGCRCTLIAALDGLDSSDAARWSNLPDDVTYREWKAGYAPTESRLIKGEAFDPSAYAGMFGDVIEPAYVGGSYSPIETYMNASKQNQAHRLTNDEHIHLSELAKEQMTSEQFDAMYDSKFGYFGGGSYCEINSNLRCGKTTFSDEMVERTVEALDHATSGITTLQEDTALTRYLGLDEIASCLGYSDPMYLPYGVDELEDELKKLIGKTMVDDAFTSTANQATVRSLAESPVMYNIIAREGTPVYARENLGEYEILLPRGIEKHVVNVRTVRYTEYSEWEDDYIEMCSIIVDVLI